MNLNKFIFLLMMLILVACSGGSNNQEEDLSPDADIANDGLEADELDLKGEIEDDLAGFSEDVADKDEIVVTDNGYESAPIATTGEVGQYTIETGDTLMLIAFKIYGDYSKWRSIQRMNPVRAQNLTIGKVIRYNLPATRFVWSPKGNPHLISRGETLGIISERYYNTSNKWKSIWNNNRPLIRDPNLIFAGFTIFYQNIGNIATN